MQIEIKKVTLTHFMNAAEADGGRASAAAMADLIIAGQEIKDVPVHVGGSHIYGGCSPREAALVVWLDDADGQAPHAALNALLVEVDPDDGKNNVEEALAADPRVIEIKERVMKEWRKV